jgi:uncharacterized protein (DUF488 family)
MKLHTIGFTKSTAEHFFTRLTGAGVKRVIDVRLHTTSQLAGFAKTPDLVYFLRGVGGIEYIHEPLLTPTEEMLKGARGGKGSWQQCEVSFLALLQARKVESRLDPAMFQNACLLCSEATPDRCHRRLVCEYLGDRWSKTLFQTIHL